MSVEPQTVADYSKNAFTFEFSITNVSSIIREQKFISPEYTVNKLSWKISVEKNSNDQLAIFIYSSPCSAKSVLWSCYAFVRLTLVSSKLSLVGFRDYSREFKHLFTSAQDGLGYNSFMDWSCVTHPDRGFIQNDAIKFRVYIEADIPKNVFSDLNVEKPQSSRDWLSLFENTLNDRIVLRVADEFKKLDATIGGVKSSVNCLKIEFKKTVDPIVDSVRNEVTLVSRKLEITNPGFKLLTTPIHDKIVLLEKKIEESCKNYVTAVENLQHSISEETENQMKIISSELIKMNNTIEEGMNNKEVLDKIAGAAVEPVCTVLLAKIQALENKLDNFYSGHCTETEATQKTLEKVCSNHNAETQVLETKLQKLSSDFSAEMQAFGEKMEKSFSEHITKVIDEFKNVNFNKNYASDNDLSNRRAVSKSERNSNEEEMITREVNVVKEKTVPLSVLNILKEIMVEQQQRMFFNHIPNSLISGPADLEGNVLYSYRPMMREPEFRLYDDVFHSSFHENGFGSFCNSGDLATGNCITDSSEMERENVSPSYDTVQQRLYKNEKRKSEEVVENNYCDMFCFNNERKMWKPNVLQEKLTGSSNEELMFLGKDEDGEWKIHKVSHSQQLEDLKKKYKNYKISRMDDF